MSTTRANQLLGLWESHQALRRTLKGAPRRQLDSPLSLWVQSNDRGIPGDLVRKNVSELLEISFDDLVDSPGVGVAKLAKLMELLERVHKGEPRTAADRAAPSTRWHASVPQRDAASPENQWAADVQALRQSGLDELPLGRLAETLADLPRTLWNAPLGQFTSLSLEALRALPYFGARRVRTIVRIVTDAARLARAAGTNAVAWQSHWIQAAEGWVKVQFSQPASAEPPTLPEVRSGLIAPLTSQLEIDLGPRVTDVMTHLAAQANPAGGRRKQTAQGSQTAAGTAISRPRLHQIKEDIRHVLAIRWPEGAGLIEALAENVGRRSGGETKGKFLLTFAELVFVQHSAATVRLVEMRPHVHSAGTVGVATSG